MSSVFASALRYFLVAAAIVAAYYSALFARASFLFQQDTATSAPAAAELVPYNASYIARLASWQPERKIALLDRAVELNPFDVNSWIQLGITEEMEQRDIPAAEHDYWRAWQTDHMFLSRWTLTNFYFRQQRSAEFFRWAKATLQITPYPADPVFTQMWLMSQNPDQIAKYVPERPGILLQYASFLANAHQYPAVAPIVQRLVVAAGTRNPADYGRDDQIGPTEDHLLAAGELQSALDIWKSMHEAKWIDLPPPTPAQPLNNGNFQIPFFRHGFDWAPISSTGVAIDQFPSDNSVRITFTGIQPEHCALLQQYLPLASNRPYRLRWQIEQQRIELPSGLAWHLYPIPNSKQSQLVAADLLSASQRTWDFTSLSDANLYLLTLEYIRPLGSVRATGNVTLRDISLRER